ncbi:copper resistance D family protein [Paenibacillus thailandensis]|uniref:Copper resistance D family protein n=1 Tax=Paenibacillus thailandensis TaxID=393250 RepID=A0ABW5QT44_9BACL
MLFIDGATARRRAAAAWTIVVAVMLYWLSAGLPAAAFAAAADSGGQASLMAAAGGGPDAADYDPHKQAGHAHGGTDQAGGLTAWQLFFYAVRAAYYAAMLFAAGIMLWFSGVKPGNAVQRGLMDKWGLLGARVLLLAVLLHIFVQADRLMAGQQGGAEEWLRLFTETNVGKSWLALLALSLLGFAALKLSDPVKAVWALLLAAAESWNGHPLASPYASASVLLDFVHLVAAAVWAGGLLLLVLFWRAERKEAGRFAESFSQAAAIALAALIVTGLGTAATLLPGWSSLFFTHWGRLLTAKSALVVLVLVTGALLRRRVRRRMLPERRLLAIDFALMAAIVAIAGLFTYMTPVPAGEPLAYHKMGETRHLTLNITPNAVGNNAITVKIWLPEQSGEPERVELLLRSAGGPDKIPVEVPLALYEDTSYEAFEGFVRYSYRAERFYLAHPGDYIAELAVTDGYGERTVEQIPFRNY